LRLPDGGDLPVRVTAARATGPGGVLVGWSARDRPARQWAAQAEEQRTEALAELGAGSPAALHQVRNPLGRPRALPSARARRGRHRGGATDGRLRASLEEIDRRVSAVLAYARPGRSSA